MAGRWRAWLPARRSAPPAPAETDPFTPPADFEPPPEDDALSLLLAEIQAGALAVYDRHGLPTRLGHYVRDPADGEWRFIAERLSPTRRFELMLEHPPEEGWRFARLEDLGARHRDHPEVEVASELLNAVSRLRQNRASASADDLAEAIRLGQAWRALNAPSPELETLSAAPEAIAQASDSTRAPLALRPPDKPKRRRKR